MPFYIQKSVRVGPFNFSLSKGGIGVSAGIKGLRIGTGPRGHYIHAGRNGLYYRSTVGGGKRAQHECYSNHAPAPPNQNQYRETDVEMIRVSSSEVITMEDARFTDLIADLSKKQSLFPMSVLFGIGSGTISFLVSASFGSDSVLGGLLFVLWAVAIGSWIDSFRRKSILMYDLEDEVITAYKALTSAFDELLACSAKWHVDAGGTVRDIHTWKRNAGAAHLLDKRPTTFNYSVPKIISSNVTPPAIKSGKETLYFFPDFLLVFEGGRVGAVPYDKLSITAQDSHFIEEGTIPNDAQIVSRTWKHPNKNGGPDRRFSNNYQIPICLYESIYLSSTNGLNELLQVSRTGVTLPFARAISALVRTNGALKHQVSVARLR